MDELYKALYLPLRISPIMESEVTTEAAPAASPESTKGNSHRLSEARRFAAEQYDKIRRVTTSQVAHVRQYTQGACSQLNNQWDTTCTKARDAHKAGEEYVKENPNASVLSALGLGVILGMLLGLILGNRR